ncbi:unnamed protein product [Musa textilis]
MERGLFSTSLSSSIPRDCCRRRRRRSRRQAIFATLRLRQRSPRPGSDRFGTEIYSLQNKLHKYLTISCGIQCSMGIVVVKRLEEETKAAEEGAAAVRASAKKRLESLRYFLM